MLSSTLAPRVPHSWLSRVSRCHHIKIPKDISGRIQRQGLFLMWQTRQCGPVGSSLAGLLYRPAALVSFQHGHQLPQSKQSQKNQVKTAMPFTIQVILHISVGVCGSSWIQWSPPDLEKMTSAQKMPQHWAHWGDCGIVCTPSSL